MRDKYKLMHEMIDDIALAFKEQIIYVETYSGISGDAYLAATRDDIILMAIVIRRYAPKYDINQFYKKAGYTGTHPVHS